MKKLRGKDKDHLINAGDQKIAEPKGSRLEDGE
jgi:hypothetical protein